MRSRGDRFRRGAALLAAALAALLVAPLPAQERGGAAEEDDLQAAIRGAVRRGAANLLETLPTIKPSPEYPVGTIALPVAALLRAGVQPDHPEIVKALRYLDVRKPGKVYCAATYLMALDALVLARHREVREKSSGGLTRAVRSGPPMAEGPVRARMEETIRWLVSVRNAGEGTWHYQGEGGHDFSNTQFAVLGLQIGLEHKIVPSQNVFAEIARQFQKLILLSEAEFTITQVSGKDVLLGRTKAIPRKTYRMQIGGWGYTAGERVPYPSMVAAGASTLLVAKNGLGGALPPPSQAALDAALGWITVEFPRYMPPEGKFHRYWFYTLYSLEKVGDLGNIASFGQHDWFEEGAERLLLEEEPGGGWGSSVDTSFALLFLTRATRSIRAMPPPRIATRAGGSDPAGGDQVYISTIDGYISAGDFMEYLITTGDRELVKVADEVVRNYPPLRQGELVPHLVSILSDGSDPVSTFARRALKDVTGERYPDRARYRDWHAAFLKLRELETAEAGKATAEDAGGLLAAAPGLKLRARLVELIGREGLGACVPVLIEELSSADVDYKKRVADVLSRLCGKPIPGREVRLPESSAPELWRALWQEEGEAILAGARLRRLIGLLDAPADSERPSRRGPDPAALIAREGREAVPYILEAMGRDTYPAVLVVALEQISGESHGLRLASWRAWWEKAGAGKR